MLFFVLLLVLSLQPIGWSKITRRQQPLFCCFKEEMLHHVSCQTNLSKPSKITNPYYVLYVELLFLLSAFFRRQSDCEKVNIGELLPWLPVTHRHDLAKKNQQMMSTHISLFIPPIC